MKVGETRFEICDIVTGLKGANTYRVTTDKAIMKVLWVREETRFTNFRR